MKEVITMPLGHLNVIQRTNDGMFNATDLIEKWNRDSGKQKQVIHFTEDKNTIEFIKILEEDLESNPEEHNSVALQTLGRNGETWMHPYLFIKFAMWLDPGFKLMAIKLYDERNKILCSAKN